MDIKRIPTRLALILLGTTLCSCVAVPKKVASYDSKCNVSVQRISLDIEPIEKNAHWSCTNDYCPLDISAEIVEAVFTTASSAVISGSVALAGNAIYWIESNGECPNKNSREHPILENQPTNPQQEKSDDKYIIQEEIITARS